MKNYKIFLGILLTFSAILLLGQPTRVETPVLTYSAATLNEDRIIQLIGQYGGSAADLPVTNGLTLYCHPTSGFVVSNGTEITQWSDASGLGHHLTQSDATKRPVLVGVGASSAAWFGWDRSYIALEFNGITNNNRDFSYFIVCQPFACGSAGFGALMSTVGNANPQLYFYTGLKLGVSGLGFSDFSEGSQPQFVGVVSSANASTVFQNDRTAVLAASSAGTIVPSYIGCWTYSYGAVQYRGFVKAVIAYSRALSGEEVYALRRWAFEKFGLQAAVANLVTVGDSITYGYLATNGASYPVQLATAHRNIQVENCGINALTAAQLAADNNSIMSTLTNNVYDTNFANNVAVVMIGVNDVTGGTAAATIYNNLTNVTYKLKDKGYKVAVCTITSSAGNNEAIRTTYNSMIRSDWTNYAAALVDVAADPIMGVSSSWNRDYWNGDNVHPSPAGYSVIAGLVWPKVQDLLYGTGGR